MMKYVGRVLLSMDGLVCARIGKWPILGMKRHGE